MIKNNRHRDRSEQLEIHPVLLENAQNWVVLKGIGKARIGKYEHETAKADLYVAIQHLCDDWVNEYPLGDGRLVTDVSPVYQGKRFHIELDLGNMEAERLLGKVERYRQFAGHGEKVIFVLRDGRYKIEQTGSWLIGYSREQRLGNFVTVTAFENFVEFPLSKVLNSPRDGWISLTELIG